MIGFYDYTVVVTYISLVSSILGMFCAIDGRLTLAAFVDIGVHQDGLVHISEMTERYIKHPLEAVSVGDVVDVRVIGVDLKKKRISLSMKGIK